MTPDGLLILHVCVCLLCVCCVPSGESLHFTCRALDDKDAKALSALAALQPTKCTLIVSINLSHNHLGDAGAVALGTALAGGAPALRKLLLHENRIGDVGVTAIAAAMRPSGAPGLRDVRLSFNAVGDAGMAAVADAFSSGGATELRELHASANTIGDAGLAALAAQLNAAPRLQVLALGSSSGGNLVGDDGARALVLALGAMEARAHGKLTINLKNNKLTPAGEAVLDEVGSAHPTLHIACRSIGARVDLGDDASPPSSQLNSREATPLTTPSGKPPESPYEA